MNVENYNLYDAIVSETEVGFVYTAHAAEDIREFNKNNRREDSLDWTSNQYQMSTGDMVILPHGNYNDLPTMLRDVIYNNYIAPGLMTKKTNLLWGNGPRLYVDKKVENNFIRDWVSDPEVDDWMESWGAEEYLLAQTVDFNYIEGTYTEFIRNRGGRIGQGFINELKHLSAKDTRLAAEKPSEVSQKPKPTHAAVSEWGFNSFATALYPKFYPLFDFRDAFKHPRSVLYSNIPAFCVDFYSLPDIFGSLEWIRRSTAIPLLLRALSKNGMNIKYHIESPSLYWRDVEKRLKERCTQNGKLYKSEMLDKFRKELFRKISKTLSGLDNAGKFWHTVKIYDEMGVNIVEAGWTIKPIDQDLKNFIEAQIKISQRADHAVSAGIQLHSALGGVSETGKSDSGSEQLYAIKNYLATSINIPEMIVCRAINHAIKANWPDKKVRVGFEHFQIQREQDITPSKRLKEQDETTL